MNGWDSKVANSCRKVYQLLTKKIPASSSRILITQPYCLCIGLCMNLFLLYPGLCCSLRQTWRSSFAEGPQTRNRLSIILSLKLLKTQPGSICSARLRIRVSLSDCSLLVRSTSSSFPPLIFTSSWIVSVLKLVPLPLPPSPVLSPFCHHFFLFLFLAIY